jgi:hypothetical protein
MNVEDTLIDMTADLAALQEHEPFLEALFARPAGTWTAIECLDLHLPRMKEAIAQIQQDTAGTLQVSWLDYPHATTGSGYCVIIFFLEELPWSRVILYNRQWFLQKLHDKRMGTLA